MIEQFCVKNRNSLGVEDWRFYQLEDWDKIDLGDRIQLIREQRIKFYDEDGEEISPNDALLELMD